MEQQSFETPDFGPMARGIAHRYGVRGEDEEVTAIAAMAVQEYLRTWDPAGGASLSSWCWFNVRCRVTRWIIAQKRWAERHLPLDDQGELAAPQEMGSDPILERVCRANLTELEWLVLAHTSGYYESKTVAQVAREYGTCRSLGYKALKAARVKMRNVLQADVLTQG